MKTDLRRYIRNIEDFPKPGVIFRDITPLLLDPRATDEALDQLCDQAKGLGITKVAAIESRGFFFGSLIAHRLGVGYIPVRKKGKLPFTTLSVTYDLEYGTDTLEIHTDAIVPGDRVLIIDQGSISQYARPDEIVHQPRNDFVRKFILRQLEIKRGNIYALFGDRPQLAGEAV
mgnify:FL=1